MQVRRVEPGCGRHARPPLRTRERAGFVASFSLADLPAAGNAPPPVALTLEARRTTARFSVDADARADFQPDGVHIHAHADVPRRGRRAVRRPGQAAQGRDACLDSTPPTAAPPPDWRQEGDDLLLTWNAGLPEASKTVSSSTPAPNSPRRRPARRRPFRFSAALVPGAERLTGYVALTSAPALRLVTTGGEERLERRDGAHHPGHGRRGVVLPRRFPPRRCASNGARRKPRRGSPATRCRWPGRSKSTGRSTTASCTRAWTR